MAEIPNTTPAPTVQEAGNRDGLWDGKVPQISFSMAETLERGGPWEFLPDDRARLLRQAERYLTQTARPESARRRVREVWVEGKYRPAWLGEGAKAAGA